jgi:hypothetical protein
VQLGLNKFVCTKLKNKYSTYGSFHISVAEDEFRLINDSGAWSAGCLIAPYYGKLMPDQVFTPIAPGEGVQPALSSLAHPVGNAVVIEAAPHSTD